MVEISISSVVKDWFSDQGWNVKTIQQDDGIRANFRFAVDGKYGMDCVISAFESISIISLECFPGFIIPKNKISAVAQYAADNRQEGGMFNILEDGSIYYLHALGCDGSSFNKSDIAHMMDLMCIYVRKTANGLVEIANS